MRIAIVADMPTWCDLRSDTESSPDHPTALAVANMLHAVTSARDWTSADKTPHPVLDTLMSVHRPLPSLILPASQPDASRDLIFSPAAPFPGSQMETNRLDSILIVVGEVPSRSPIALVHTILAGKDIFHTLGQNVDYGHILVPHSEVFDGDCGFSMGSNCVVACMLWAAIDFWYLTVAVWG